MDQSSAGLGRLYARPVPVASLRAIIAENEQPGFWREATLRQLALSHDVLLDAERELRLLTTLQQHGLVTIPLLAPKYWFDIATAEWIRDHDVVVGARFQFPNKREESSGSLRSRFPA